MQICNKGVPFFQHHNKHSDFVRAFLFSQFWSCMRNDLIFSFCESSTSLTSSIVSYQKWLHCLRWTWWSHCLDLDLNGKRPGITSDGNFSSYLIGKNWYNHFRSFSMGGNGGLHWQGMANAANQPISEKLPKWHF